MYTIVPAPPAVSTSTSISPSPFAPPPASAPIAVPVSQSLPLLASSSSSSSSSHLTVKAKSPDVLRAHSDQLTLESNLDADEHPVRSEYVMDHTSASTSHPDAGEARPRGNSTVGHLDTLMHDLPDQVQPRVLSRQVCLSSRAVLLSACVYTYVSYNRVQCCRLWILPIAPRHHAPLRGARRRPLCSFLPRLRVSRPLTPRPTLFVQKNPMHQILYPSIHLRRHHRHRRSVGVVGVTHRSSPSPTSKDGN